MASYMFHTPALNIAPLQAKAMDIPLIMKETLGEKEEELLDLQKALEEAKEKYHVEGIVSGALFSTYQRDRIEQICDKLGLKIFAPLWHKPQDIYLQELLNTKFEIILTAVAADGLDESWLGRKVDQAMIQELKKLHARNQLNLAFEGGEAETLVLDCPLFSKKISLLEVQKEMNSPNSGILLIKKAELVNK